MIRLVDAEHKGKGLIDSSSLPLLLCPHKHKSKGLFDSTTIPLLRFAHKHNSTVERLFVYSPPLIHCNNLPSTNTPISFYSSTYLTNPRNPSGKGPISPQEIVNGYDGDNKGKITFGEFQNLCRNYPMIFYSGTSHNFRIVFLTFLFLLWSV